MKTIRILALAALSLAAACADAAVTEPSATPAGPSRVAVPPVACVTFGPAPAAWTVWGAPAGDPVGTVVHVENTIPVTVQRLALPGGGWIYDHAQLEPAAAIGWGTFNSVRMLDISTEYHFMAAGGWVPTHVRFLYQDLGGIENLAVNGALYVGDIAFAPAVLGGANVVVGAGVVDIAGGPINNVRIGGRNFRVDDVCAAP
jgi:hypothetical protein